MSSPSGSRKPPQSTRTAKKQSSVSSPSLNALPNRSVYSDTSRNEDYHPQQSTEIFIPSVKSWVDLSPRTAASKDSRSLLTSSPHPAGGFSNPSEKLPGEKAFEITPGGRVIINLPGFLDDSRPVTTKGDNIIQSATLDLPPFDPQGRKVVPIHRASGELSVSVVTSDSNPLRKRKKFANNRSSLWGDDENTLEALEEARAQAERFQKLAEDEKEAELTREQEEREMMIKIKVINTLFDKKITTTDGPMKARLMRAFHQQNEKAAAIDENTNHGEHQEGEGSKNRKTELFKNAVAASLPKFRSKDWRQEKIREGTSLSAEEKAHAVKEITATIGTLADTGAKTKLKNLAQFVGRHTSRKVLSCWNMIEGRFKGSPHFKTVLQPDPHGLMHPVKFNALYLSSIVSLLCSSRVKVGHQEVTAILQQFNASEADIKLARRIAAYNAVIQVSIETKSLLTDTYKAEVTELMKDENSLMSIQELTDLIFSSDPLKRNEEFAFVKGNRQNEANKMLEEKRRKDDLKDQLEKRRKKLIDDFEKIIEQIQLFKGTMTQNRIDAFAYLIRHCQKVVDEHHEDHSSRVPVDLVTFIGIDAFPDSIRHLIVARMQKTTRRQAKILDANQVKILVQAVEEKKKIEDEEAQRRHQRREKERKERGLEEERDRGRRRAESLESANNESSTASDDPNHIARPSEMFGNHHSYDSNDDSSLERRRSSHLEDYLEEGEGGNFNREKSMTAAKSSAYLLNEEEEESYESKVLQLLLSDQSTQIGSVASVKLFGPPVAMQAMREMVALGKTFPGFSYRDAVEVFQYIGATKVAAFLRCRHRRWRYAAAQRKWKAIFSAIKGSYYQIWADFTRHTLEVRRYCLRKIIAWKYYTKRAKDRRELFRALFWPFYVWRKSSSQSATAKEKTKFLVGRVMPTVLKLKVFHAWKKVALFETQCKKLSVARYNQYLHRKLIASFLNWSFFSYQHRFLRRAWNRRGVQMMRKNLRSRLTTTFYLWRVFVNYRKYIRSRIRTEFFSFKQRLLRYKKPWKKLSFADKRLRASMKRRANIEFLRKEALKKQQRRKSVVIGQVARRMSIADDRSISSTDSNDSLKISEKLNDVKEFQKDPLNHLNALAAEKQVPISVIKNENKVKRKNKSFDWKQDQKHYFDMDSDGEDDIDLPPLLVNLYNEMLLNIQHKHGRRFSQVRATIASFSNNKEKEAEEKAETEKANSTTKAEVSEGVATEQLASMQPKPTSPSSLTQFSQQTKMLYNLPSLPRDIGEESMVNKLTEGHFYHPEYLDDKVASINRGFQYRDIWNLFESAFRWHRFAHVAFTNLRHYAKVKRRVRNYNRQQAFLLAAFYFQEWKIFLKKNLDLIAQANGEGDVVEDIRSKKSSVNLYHNLRSHLLQKTIKLRRLNDEIRQYYRKYYSAAGMESDDEYDEEKRARKKIRALNQLDMGEKSWEEDEDEDLSSADKFNNYYRLKKAQNAESSKLRPPSAKKQPKPNPLANLDFNAILNSNTASSGGAAGASHHGQLQLAGAQGSVPGTARSTVINSLGVDFPVHPGQFNNLFEWDNYNRELEIKYTEEMVKYSHKVKGMTKSLIETSAAEHLTVITVRQQLNETIEEIFQYEANITNKAILKQREYSIMFKIHAANYLLMKLAKVYYEVQYTLIKEETKKFFRRLRMPMSNKRSLRLFRRKRLQNYIRLCRRLQYINKHAAYYYKRRVEYVNFMRWVRYLEKVKLNPTPNFVTMIKRRLLLHPDFHEALLSRGFGKMSGTALYENSSLQESLSDFQMIFKRWKMFTQEAVLFRFMEEKVQKLYLLKLLLKSFVVLKNSSVNSLNYLHYMAENYPEDTSSCFPIIRLKADLSQLSKRFIPLRKKQLPARIKKNNMKISHKMKTMGKESLTYKKFLTDFQAVVMQRINTEQRLLFEAFEARGKQEFIDVQYPFSRDDPIIPPLMSKIEGKMFRDPHLPANMITPSTPGTAYGDRAHSALRDSNIPAGFRLHKVKFAMIIHNVQNSAGDAAPSSSSPSSVLMGWQFVWNAEGIREIESTARGAWNAAGVSIQEITIPKDDFVIGVEYLYDGPTIVSIRLRLLQNGFTRWIGGKASLSTLSLYLDVNMSPQEDFESDRHLHEDELKQPALPFRYVVGFSGILYNGRPTCLGLMIRKIRYQHIFSFQWVYDVIIAKRFLAKNTEQPALAITKGIQAPISVGDGVGSIPSEIKFVDNGQKKKGMTAREDDLIDESLTLSRNDSQELGNAYGAGQSIDDEDQREGSEASSLNLQPTEEILKNGKSLDDSDGENTQKTNEDPDKEGGHGLDDDSYTNSNNENDGSSVEDALQDEQKGKSSEVKRKHALKKFMQWTKRGRGGHDEPLTVSETQFFDVLRMRLTELTVAKTRAEEFSRKLWTSKDLRFDPELSKLLSLPIIASLTKWLFNALSKKLGKVCASEQRGLQYIKQSRKLLNSLKSIQKRKLRCTIELKTLELTPQSWQNKHMLGPLERQQKKDYLRRIQDIRQQIAVFDQEIDETRKKSAEFERKGRLLLPRIALSLPVYNNFKVKLAAARHKQNLLENMTLDEIKNGLFGSNMKETLLNKDQMEAIHSSLKDRKIVMKDTTSLQRLVDNILVEEEKNFRQDQFMLQHTQYLQNQIRGHAEGIAAMPRRPPAVVQYSKKDSLNSPARASSPTSRASHALSSGAKNLGGSAVIFASATAPLQKMNKHKSEKALSKTSGPASSDLTGNATATKLPLISRRFQTPQLASSSVDRLQRRFSSGSHVVLTNENSPEASIDDLEQREHSHQKNKSTTKIPHGNAGMKSLRSNMNINLTINTMHDEIDETSVASNAISELSFGSPQHVKQPAGNTAATMTGKQKKQLPASVEGKKIAKKKN